MAAMAVSTGWMAWHGLQSTESTYNIKLQYSLFVNSRSTLTHRLQQTVHGGLSEETIDRSIDVVDNYYDHGNDVYIID